jgi:hypothetical protein
VSTTGKWEELFGGGRRWRVCEELTGRVAADGFLDGKLVPGLLVVFERGTFECPAGAYQSVLSTNKAKRGVVLQETTPDGSADIPFSRVAVGAPAVQRARERYAAVW